MSTHTKVLIIVAVIVLVPIITIFAFTFVLIFSIFFGANYYDNFRDQALSSPTRFSLPIHTATPYPTWPPQPTDVPLPLGILPIPTSRSVLSEVGLKTTEGEHQPSITPGYMDFISNQPHKPATQTNITATHTTIGNHLDITDELTTGMPPEIGTSAEVTQLEAD